MNRVDFQPQSRSEEEIRRSNNRFVTVLGVGLLGLTAAVTTLTIRNSEATPVTEQDISDVASCAVSLAGSTESDMAVYVQSCESQLGVKLGDQFDFTVQRAESMQP